MKPLSNDTKAEFEALQGRLTKWRESNTSRGKRIPPELWEEAVQLARVLGPGKVSGRLKLFYPTLKRRMKESLAPVNEQRRGSSSKLSFMEVPLGSPVVPTANNNREPRFLLRFTSKLGTVKLELV
jgi:hypothetical protein